MLTCLIEYALDEMTSWVPRNLLLLPMADDEPIAQVARAMLARNTAALQRATDAARSRYSRAGFDLLVRGLAEVEKRGTF